MMDKFLNKLCLDSNDQRNVIEEIRNSKEPLVLWGNGVIAHIIMVILQEYKISVSAICVDVRENADEACGIAIKSWREIDEEYDSYNVIVGHSAYELGSLIQTTHSRIHKMFYFPSVDYGYALFRKELIKENLDGYKKVLEMLEDDESRECIIAFLNTRMSGDISYTLSVFKKRNTFFRNDVYEIGNQEVYWDIGACDGDTISQFLEESQVKYEQIVAMEPDSNNIRKLRTYIKEAELKNVYPFEIGAWETNTELLFETLPNKCSRIIEADTWEGSAKIKADTIDHILELEQQVKPPTLLKFDYGIGVREALKGAAQVLSQHYPKLAIGIGFDEYSFVDIISTIKAINSDYKLYARFNTGMASTIFLYGICKGEER